MISSLYKSLQEMITWTDIVLASVVFIITWVIYKVVIQPAMSPIAKIPGERGSLLLGFFYDAIQNQDTADMFAKKFKKANSNITRVYGIFGQGGVAIADREAYKYVTVLNNKNYPKPESLYRAMINMIGNGLVTLNGEEHRTHRKLCMGAFKYSFLQGLVGKVSRHCSELVGVWEKLFVENTNGSVNLQIKDDLSRATLDVIIDIAFDFRSKILHDPHDKVSKAFEDMLGTIGLHHMFKLFKYLPTPGNITFIKNRKLLDNIVLDMIERKRTMIRDSGGDMKIDNLLTMLLLAEDEESGVKLNTQQLRDHVMTFLFAGYETTATTLTWCLYALATHQEIQQKVRDEIMSVVPSEDIHLNGDHLEAMSYQLCVIKETLRVHTTVAALARIALNDDHIGGYFVPKGSAIHLCVSSIHMDPNNWEEPDKFVPERFLDESKIKPFSFIPFTSGPRMCIGHKFAFMEMQVFLTYLLRKFEFHLTPGMENVKKAYIFTAIPKPPIVLEMKKVQ